MSEFQAWVEKNKALWTRVYDEVMAPDFEKEWEKSKWGVALMVAITDRTIRRGKAQARIEQE
jgi:hypothetical protein